MATIVVGGLSYSTSEQLHAELSTHNCAPKNEGGAEALPPPPVAPEIGEGGTGAKKEASVNRFLCASAHGGSDDDNAQLRDADADMRVGAAGSAPAPKAGAAGKVVVTPTTTAAAAAAAAAAATPSRSW
jgi:hypothetical protein